MWLSLNQMADLFNRDKSTISRHIKNVFEEGELAPERVVAKSATTASDGKTCRVEHYNLDVIISVGYLELAELQAMNRIAMTMDDWLGRLHDFLTMTGRDLLEGAGLISRDQALRKAHREYETFKTRQLESPSEAERHFGLSVMATLGCSHHAPRQVP